MNKSVTVAILVSVVIVVIGAALVWWLLANPVQAPQPQQNSGDVDQSGSSGEVQSGEVDVSIANSAYSPATITVKKGTKVAWTNNDSMGHNVVAVDQNNSGGLPSEHALLNKGETFEQTFDTVREFDYTCTPHPFMRGKVVVVE